MAGQISTAIGKNGMTVNGRKVTVLKAAVQRRYKGMEGNWESSSSVGNNGILLSIYWLEKSFEHTVEGQKDDRVK